MKFDYDLNDYRIAKAIKTLKNNKINDYDVCCSINDLINLKKDIKNMRLCLYLSSKNINNINNFLNSIMRYEYEENPRVYTKAIRSTLIALGYNSDYINGDFRDYMEKYYKDNFE